MPTTIYPILHPTADKKGLQKVYIRAIYNKFQVYEPTDIKVPKDNFKPGTNPIVKHKDKVRYNLQLQEKVSAIGQRLYDAERSGIAITKHVFTEIVKNNKVKDSGFIQDYILDLVTRFRGGKISDATLKNYRVVAEHVEAFHPRVTFEDISLEWLEKYENFMCGRVTKNSVHSYYDVLKRIFNIATDAGLMKYEQFHKKRNIKYNRPKPEYLSEEEIEKFYETLKTIRNPNVKLAGYYYMLSCFTGYRISDAMAFNYRESVIGNQVMIQATKNKAIVATPIFPQLAEVLEYIKDKPMNRCDETVRLYVKQVLMKAGIDKDMSYHSARHTYAMRLVRNGFSLEEVAELIGDTETVAKVYARVENQDLSRKLMNTFGEKKTA